MLKAVIFDLDGVLVDSTPLHQKAAQLLLEKYGKLHIPGGGREGMRIIDIIREYKDIYDLPGSVEDLYEERQTIFYSLVWEQLELLPEVLPLLQTLELRRLKIALATSGDRRYVQLLFKKFPQFGHYFTCIVTGDDVRSGKPNPEIYQKTAKQLGVLPVECIVIEDSVNGITSGKGAGMVVIAIPNRHYPDADYSRADQIFPSLKQVLAAIPN